MTHPQCVVVYQGHKGLLSMSWIDDLGVLKGHSTLIKLRGRRSTLQEGATLQYVTHVQLLTQVELRLLAMLDDKGVKFRSHHLG